MTHLHVWRASFMCASMRTNGEGTETGLFCLDMKKSYHTYKWFLSHLCSFMSQTQMSHVTHVNGPCHKYDAAIQARGGDIEICPHIIFSNLHVQMSHATQMNESFHTYKSILSHVGLTSCVQMCNVTHMNASCHTYQWETRSQNIF